MKPTHLDSSSARDSQLSAEDAALIGRDEPFSRAQTQPSRVKTQPPPLPVEQREANDWEQLLARAPEPVAPASQRDIELNLRPQFDARATEVSRTSLEAVLLSKRRVNRYALAAALMLVALGAIIWGFAAWNDRDASRVVDSELGKTSALGPQVPALHPDVIIDPDLFAGPDTPLEQAEAAAPAEVAAPVQPADATKQPTKRRRSVISLPPPEPSHAPTALAVTPPVLMIAPVHQAEIQPEDLPVPERPISAPAAARQ